MLVQGSGLCANTFCLYSGLSYEMGRCRFVRVLPCFCAVVSGGWCESCGERGRVLYAVYFVFRSGQNVLARAVFCYRDGLGLYCFVIAFTGVDLTRVLPSSSATAR